MLSDAGSGRARASSRAACKAWRERNFELAVREATPSRWVDAERGGAPVVHDGGFTEVEPNTQTALAVLPWLS